MGIANRQAATCHLPQCFDKPCAPRHGAWGCNLLWQAVGKLWASCGQAVGKYIATATLQTGCIGSDLLADANSVKRKVLNMSQDSISLSKTLTLRDRVLMDCLGALAKISFH